MADGGRWRAESGWRFLCRPATRWTLCWLVAFGAAAIAAQQSWTIFDDPERAAGHRNSGHTKIDFGGQWIMGRTIVEANGARLYDRDYLRTVAEAHYPDGVESTKAPYTDAQYLLMLMVGRDDGEVRVGGALYPPIHALFYSPLALLSPPRAYRLVQMLVLVLAFVDGGLIERMTAGRIWWPLATVFVLVFPGFSGCISLGQNGIVSLTLVLLGWLQLMRGRDVLAGACWGLLAFKPVWAAAFLLVPLLTRRWRMAASMAVLGIVQILVTLPVVGWRTWLDWLHVGQIASYEYLRQENWIFLSRDVMGIPRRWLLDFEGGVAWEVENHPLPTILGWCLWAAILFGTLFVAWRGRRRMNERTGPAAAFILIGAIFSCYHFMYYDFIVAALPVLLLFTEPRRYWRALCWRWPPRNADEKDRSWRIILRGLNPQLRCASVPIFLLLVMLVGPLVGYCVDPSYHFPPVDTFALLLLWAWCGYRVLNGRRTASLRRTLAPEFAEFAADVGGAHQGFADQHGANADRL